MMKYVFLFGLFLFLLSCAGNGFRNLEINSVVNFEYRVFSNEADVLYKEARRYFAAKGVVSDSRQLSDEDQSSDLPSYLIELQKFEIRERSVASVKSHLSQQRQLSARFDFKIIVFRGSKQERSTSFSQTFIRFLRYDATNPLGYEQIKRKAIKSLVKEHTRILYQKTRHFIKLDINRNPQIGAGNQEKG